MSFTNVTVDPAELPRAADLEWTAMPPEYRREALTQSVITLAVLLIGAFGMAVVLPYPPRLNWLFAGLIPGLIMLIGLIFTLLAMKKIRLQGYAVRTHDIAYRSGLFWRKVVMLPFNRVQHVEVTSGPLQRRFGLATLKFYTAGGKSVDLRIDGLRAEDAERLRANILARSALAEETI